MSDLWTLVALREHPDRPGVCWAWVDSRDAICGRPEGGEAHLCTRHLTVARRRAAEAAQRQERQRARARAELLRRLPERRARLAKIEAEIARLDPPPATDDPAAFGGVSSSVAAQHRAKFTPERVARLAELTREAEQLRRAITAAENIEKETL